MRQRLGDERISPKGDIVSEELEADGKPGKSEK